MTQANVLSEVISTTLMIAVYGTAQPNEAEWKLYIDHMRALDEPIKVLICSAGGGPTALQRSTIEELIADRQSTAAVVTASRSARGIVTALSWFKQGIRAFPPNKMVEAMVYLGLEQDEIDHVQARVAALARRLEVQDVFGL